VPLAAFESSSFFDHVQRVDTNALGKPLDIVNSVVNILSGTLTIGGLGFVIATTEPIVLPMLVLSALPVYLANRAGSRLDFRFALSQVPRQRERAYVGNLMKARDAAKEVRAYQLGPVLRARWEMRYSEFISDLRRMISRRVAYTVGAAAVSAVILAATMFMLVNSIHGPSSLTSVATALVAMRLLAAQLQSAAGGFTGLYESRLFLEDLADFLAYRPEPPVQALRPAGGLEQVELRDVGFTYPGAVSPSLQNISMSLSTGEIVALVGENGSGKTTLAKVLAGLHQPTQGSMLWNRADVDEIDPEQLRSRIAVVFQDYLKYEFTVTENIAFGRTEVNVDEEAVRRAARQAGADTFIETMPGQYEARLSKVYANGTDLSIGQWQRMALARAFYRDADLVILDEPTAALDPRAEQALFEKTRELFKGRTVVLISHRFSSVRSADRILVMQAGRIVESGSHEQLMDERGLYHELFTLQAEAYLGLPRV
jgi:ATP-binding cassette, subfamily B, bacterial